MVRFTKWESFNESEVIKMSASVGGVPVQGVIVASIQAGKGIAQSVVQSMIDEGKNNPAKFLKEIQQPSGLSSFLDIKI
jgi:hypothetical protein